MTRLRSEKELVEIVKDCAARACAAWNDGHYQLSEEIARSAKAVEAELAEVRLRARHHATHAARTTPGCLRRAK